MLMMTMMIDANDDDYDDVDEDNDYGDDGDDDEVVGTGGSLRICPSLRSSEKAVKIWKQTNQQKHL